MIYFIIILSVFFLALLLITFGRYRGTPKKLPKNYIKGLELLSDGDSERAIEYLNRAWKEDPENIDAYLRVGDILREMGKANSAIMIHRNLSVKPLIPRDKKIRVLKSLAEDYIAMKKYGEATKVLIKSMHEGDESQETARKLLWLFEMQEEWEKAYETARNIFTDRKKLYSYGVYVGMKLLKKDPDRAYHYIRQGFKAKIPLAKLANAFYLLEKEDINSGIKELINVLKEYPSYSESGLGVLEKLMFDRGRFSEIESVYRDIIEKDPMNITAINHYVDFLLKKGDKNKALDLITNLNLPDNHPDTLHLKLTVYAETDIERIKELTPMLIRACKSTRKYKCRECGYETEVFDWKCPNCLTVDSFVRV
ncbi:hypothetical protein DRQ17_01605 [bacterium]|nr:MAG: hypothetical protein DRQ17_01605 [bacterium]